MSMNQEMYLSKLRRRIKSLPDNERETIIDFYREIIQDKIENGESEAQAVAELGEVNVLAEKILMENPNRKPANMGKAIIITLVSILGVAFVAILTVSILKAINFPNAKITNRVTTSLSENIQEEKTFTSPDNSINNIHIEAENKKIIVRKGVAEKATITYFDDSAQTYTVTAENGVLKLINTDKTRYNFNFSNDSCTTITISVPESYKGVIYVNTSNGDINVSNVMNLSDLTCDTSNATIKLNKVQAENIIMDTSNSRINMLEVKANTLSADSSNGDITFKEITSPDMIFDTSNADIEGSILGREEDYSIHTDTSNGKCTPSSQRGGSKKLTADTSNGNIKIDFI